MVKMITTLRLLHLTTSLTNPQSSFNFNSHFSLSFFSKPKQLSSSTPSLPSSSRGLSVRSAMDNAGGIPTKEVPVGLDASAQEEFASLSVLLQEFSKITTIDKAWTIKPQNEDSTSAMFLIGQPDLLSNKRRKSILTSHISQKTDSSVSFRWAPFPVEMTGVSAMVPSPSGSKLLVVRNSEGDSPTHFEIWGASELKKDFAIPRKIHGSVYTDGW